jgi:hypothetical protein
MSRACADAVSSALMMLCRPLHHGLLFWVAWRPSTGELVWLTQHSLADTAVCMPGHAAPGYIQVWSPSCQHLAWQCSAVPMEPLHALFLQADMQRWTGNQSKHCGN